MNTGAFYETNVNTTLVCDAAIVKHFALIVKVTTNRVAKNGECTKRKINANNGQNRERIRRTQVQRSYGYNEKHQITE